MKILRHIFDLAGDLLFANNGFIAICSVFFFTGGYLFINHGWPSFGSMSLIFFCTLLVYQVNTKIKFSWGEKSSLKYKKGRRFGFILLLGIVLIALLSIYNFSSIIFLLHLGVLSLLYNVPEKSISFSINPLRSIPIIKIFLISYVWSAMSSLFPAILHNLSLASREVITVFIGNFMFITSITLPFDIRDHQIDKDRKIITFPGIIGVTNTKALAIFSLIIFFLIYHKRLDLLLLSMFTILVAFLILISSPFKKQYFFLFYLDGTIILYFFVVLLSLSSIS